MNKLGLKRLVVYAEEWSILVGASGCAIRKLASHILLRPPPSAVL
jgi:hypothetical protein